jgi:hypothetical protein
MLRYLDAFENFDPLVDTPSEEMRWKVGYIIQQARTILPPSFTIKELNEGLEILFKLKSLKPISQIEWNAYLEEQGIDVREGYYHTPALDNYLNSQFAEIPLRDNGELFKWSWLFAVGALACISDYVWVDMTRAESNSDSEEVLSSDYETSFNQTQQPGLIIDGIEYLGFARLLREKEESSESELKRKKAIQKTKLDNYHPLKQAVIESLQSLPTGLSTRKAAKEIYSNLPVNLKLISKSEDPAHQIEAWIRQWKNGTLPGQDRLPSPKK